MECGVPLKGGNNRLFPVTKDGVPGVVKVYYRHPSDPRDRQKHEWEFSRYLWTEKVREIPQPIEINREAGWSFFSLIQGVRPSEISENEVESAKKFLLKINRRRESAEALMLSIASEAKFKIEDQIEGIQGRLERLLSISGESSLHEEVKRRVSTEVLPTYQRMVEKIQSAIPVAERGRMLDQCERILSPSDFGFHNTLKGADGSISFLDFEYAGWDDPVKCLSDFFYQPAVPVEEKYFKAFVEEVISELKLNRFVSMRLEALRPFYRIKWGCILLNELLPVSKERRAEASGEVTFERLCQQWAKAKIYFGLEE